MQAPFWSVLGIDPTPSEADIRRAYAFKLRSTNPEDDSEGFKELRAAYENALQYARYMQMRSQADAVAESSSDPESDAEEGYGNYDSDEAAVLPTSVTAFESAELESAAQEPEGIERRHHDELCRRLLDALNTSASPDDLLNALEAILSSPAMQQIDIFTGTENWVARLLTASRPASDLLFEPAISFFKWDEERVGDRTGIAQHVIGFRRHVREEQEANRLLARLKDRKHEYHAAWKETMLPPSQRSWLNKLASFNRTSRVMEFLTYIRGRNLIVLNSLNHEAVMWWQRRAPMGLRVAVAFRLWLFVAVCFVVGILWVNFFRAVDWQAPARPPTLVAVAAPPKTAVRPIAGAYGPTHLELVPADASEPVKRRAARRDCREAVKRLGEVPAGVKTFTTTRADVSCKKALEMTPDSLLMHQYAGIAALRLSEPEKALDHFEAILEASPDDAYALFGKGFVSTLGLDGMDLGDPKDMSDALAMNADVVPYFEAFGVSEPDVKPSPRKPGSRMPRPKPILVDTDAEQLKNLDERSGDLLAEHFGLDNSTAGVVVLECVINAKGVATKCHIKSEEPSNVGLGEVGLLAMKDVRFKPPRFEGKPVGGMMLTYTLSYNTREENGADADQ